MRLQSQMQNKLSKKSTLRLGKANIKFATLLCLCLGTIVPTAIMTTPAYAINKDQSEQAEKDYENALINFHNGEPQKAKIHLKNALQANARHLPSRILMAKILIKEGDGSGAEIELNFARQRGADYNQLIVHFGYAYILQNKNKHLLDVIHSGNRDDTIEAEILYLRGRAYFGNKKLANAKRSYSQALEKNSKLQLAKLGLAQIAAVYEQYDLALQYIDSVLSAPNPTPNAWILKSKIYKQRGFNKGALEAINEALEQDDTNIVSRLTRAALYIDTKEFDKANEDVDFILEQIPREPRAKYLKAIINAAQGDASESKIKMTEIINTLRAVPPEVMKANPTYYYLSGLTNFQFGNLDEARDSLQQYLKMERDDISAMRLLGALELQAGNPSAANLVLTEAYRSQPNNPTILTMLGMVYLELGNTDKANYYLETVTKLLPDSSEGLTNLARGRMAAGSFNDAIDNLLKAEQHNFGSLDVKLLLAKAYQQARQYGKAVKIIGELRDKDPENAVLLNLYGTAIGLDGNHAEARESYLKAMELDKNNVTSLIHLARMDVIEGKADQALKALKGKLDDLPDDYYLMLEVGNIYKALNQLEDALFWYKKAYSLNGKSYLVMSSLVECLLQNNDTKSALGITAEFINHFPTDAGAYNLRGQLFERAGNPVEAIKNYKLAAEYDVKRGQALLTLANAQLRNNAKSAAKKTLQKALAWNEELSHAYIALIKIAIDDQDRKTGFALLKNLRRLEREDNPAADILSGDLYIALKEYDKAEKSYLTALRIGDNPVAIIGLYQAYQKSGQMETAIATLEKWYEKYPEDIRTALALGNAYKRGGQLKKSVAFHDSLLTTNPNMPVILNNAATVNFITGNQQKALEYAQKANEVLPENPSIMDTLAWIESRLGRPEVALPLLRKALVLNFSNPEIKYHLALTLDMLNRRGEAQKLLKEAVQSNTEFSEKAAAAETLKKWQGK